MHPMLDFVNLPAYAAGPPAEPRTSWEYRLKRLSASASASLTRLQEMTESEGLRASDLLAGFMERRRFPGQSADGAPVPGYQYRVDRAESDADDPELGASTVEDDDAVGGSGEGAGDLGEWPDDDDEDNEPRRAHGTDRTGAGSSAVPATAGAPHLSRASSGSVIGAAEGSAGPRSVDPLADLQQATERNAREAREEREAAAREKAEAAKATKAEADATAKAEADTAAREQADVAAKAQAEEASRSRALESTCPQHVDPPVPEGQAPTREAGADQSALERGGGDHVVLGAEDYHNIRAAAFNSQVQELAKRTTDLNQSWKATADLRKCLGEVESELRTKEQERSQAAQECDRLTKELADQAERHKAELQKLKDSEAHLQAEFETQRSNWAEKEKIMTDGYEFFPDQSVTVSQAIEARRDMQRRAGAEIVPNVPRTLGEQLLTVQARLRPVHGMLRRLQRAWSQVLSALWPDAQVPRTPNRIADWSEIVVGRFEAWKGAAAWAGAKTALEFVKAWYPSLDLA
nr:uncharacterized abhydrolase domain-containing protein DDB_G0269086-like [Aegilops tauschii subsp. strangulata]